MKLGSEHGGPLRIGVLVSATGNNLSTLLAMEREEPGCFRVCLVAGHNDHSRALKVATGAGVPTWPGDFDRCCGLASAAVTLPERERYRAAARAWHDRLDQRIRDWEERNSDLDLIVLAYHRWIEGDLLDRFAGRMINQHPGDLSLLAPNGRRLLVGRDPVRLAMAAGQPSTRTSCFLVDGSQDGGAVLCMGPPVPVGDRTADAEGARDQELEQKVHSDRPCLRWTVRAFAAGRLGLSGRRHRDGSPEVLLDGAPTPLGGMRLERAAS